MTNWVFTEENRPGRKDLSDAMVSYITQFTRAGNPNETGSNLTEWIPWPNSVDKPKCILLDADRNAIDVSMSITELTRSDIMATMQSEPLYAEAIEFMSSTWTISYLLEDNE